MLSRILFGKDIKPLVGVSPLLDLSGVMGHEGFLATTLTVYPEVNACTVCPYKAVCGMGTSNAELICLVDRELIDTASMSWTRGTLIAFNGESRVFDPVKRIVIVIVYSW